MTINRNAAETVRPVGVFPQSDQLGLGAAHALVETAAMPPSTVRPFGLRLGVVPDIRNEQTVTLDDLRYDDERQIGLFRLGTAMMPWHKHTDGRTKTRTNLDGHKGPDSDVDHRED